jgi:hypothetical protein
MIDDPWIVPSTRRPTPRESLRWLWDITSGLRFSMACGAVIALCGWLVDQPWIIYAPLAIFCAVPVVCYVIFRVRSRR